MIKRTLKSMLAVALTVAALAGPVRQAQAADLAFPILFVPVWSQNQFIPGPAVFTDTRVTIFNPSDPFFGFFPFDVLALIFDHDERLIALSSIPMTPFDVEVLTGGAGLPNGTGTMILINTFSGFSPPIVAFPFPLAAVVEIGVKLAAGGQLDPVNSPPAPAGSFLSSVIASEAQFIPAVAGEFPRVEVTTTLVNPGTPLFFPGPGFETIIVETCLLQGIVHNFYVDDDENFLFDRAIPCTGIHVALVAGTPTLFGPDLLIMTPDDGGLLTTIAAAQNILQDANPAHAAYPPLGYHLMAIDVNTFGGPLAPFGETFFHGQAGVYLPTNALSGTKEAYSYNMPANYFGSRSQTPTNSCSGIGCLEDALGAATTGALDLVGRLCTTLGPSNPSATPPTVGAGLIDCEDD